MYVLRARLFATYIVQSKKKIVATQVAAADTAFVMATQGATFVSMPPVLADVDPTTALDTLTVIMHLEACTCSGFKCECRLV